MTTRTRTRSSMTRQHFEAIADGIRRVDGVNIREEVVEILVPILRGFNESFNEERFRRACRVRIMPAPPPIPASFRSSSSYTMRGAAPVEETDSAYRYPARQVQRGPHAGRWVYNSQHLIPDDASIRDNGRGEFNTNVMVMGEYVETSDIVDEPPVSVRTRRRFQVTANSRGSYNYVNFAGPDIAIAEIAYGHFRDYNGVNSTNRTGFSTAVAPPGVNPFN